MCDEVADVDDNVQLKVQKESVLSEIYNRYKPCKVFNFDECGLQT